MKILKLTIKNYRSCAETVFEPNPNLSVLIGPNGSGKTNILSAIKLLQALCLQSRKRVDKDSLESSSPAEIIVEYSVDEFKVIYSAKISILNNEKNVDEIISASEEWSLPSIAGRRKKLRLSSQMIYEFITAPQTGSSWNIDRRSHFQMWLKAREVIPESFRLLQKIVSSVMNITYYSASQFTNPGNAPISFEVESETRRRLGISISGHKQLLYDIYQEYLLKSDTYNEFISLIGPEGIGLIDTLEFEEIKTSSSNYTVRTGGNVVVREKTNSLVIPRIKIYGNTLSPSQLSEGSFKTFALIFCLVIDKSSILMIEEPEVCVHHGLLSSIVELIKIYSSDKQIILSTHSDFVLDKLEISNVFKVKRSEDKGTEVTGIKKSFNNKEISALKKYLENEGSLGEYWRHGELE